MSEEKAEKKPKEKPAKEAASEGQSSIASYSPEKRKKQAWTLERCQKIARRFFDEKEWAASSPSSYKAAQHHDWIRQCHAEFGKNAVSLKPSKSIKRTA